MKHIFQCIHNLSSLTAFHQHLFSLLDLPGGSSPTLFSSHYSQQSKGVFSSCGSRHQDLWTKICLSLVHFF